MKEADENDIKQRPCGHGALNEAIGLSIIYLPLANGNDLYRILSKSEKLVQELKITKMAISTQNWSGKNLCG